MKKSKFKLKRRVIEINNDIEYIKKYFDYNMTQEKVVSQLDYDIKKDSNCVKSVLKR